MPLNNVVKGAPQSVGVIADIHGTELSAEDVLFIQQPELSGLILFSRNYQSPDQLQRLTQSILRQRPDFLICVDHEGGRVQRFRDGFTRLPAMFMLANMFETLPEKAQHYAYEMGWLMAYELRLLDVHLSFAPVLDLQRGISEIIGDRAFGRTVEQIVTLAGHFIDGMKDAGMAAVGKHFPGHGSVAADSHLALPVDERSLSDISEDIAPFTQLIAQHKIAGIMPAHVLYPQGDAEYPAGFSRYWLQETLRTALNFRGVIFSDDLTMEGAASFGSYRQRAEAAIAAGCNAILVCNDRQAAQETIDAVRAQPHVSPLDLSGWQGKKPTLDIARHERAQQCAKDLGNYDGI